MEKGVNAPQIKSKNKPLFLSFFFILQNFIMNQEFELFLNSSPKERRIFQNLGTPAWSKPVGHAPFFISEQFYAQIL